MMIFSKQFKFWVIAVALSVLSICYAEQTGQAQLLGDGYGYLAGQYLLTSYTARRDGNSVIVEIASQQGKMSRPKRNVIVELITDKGVIKAEGNETKQIVINM